MKNLNFSYLDFARREMDAAPTIYNDIREKIEHICKTIDEVGQHDCTAPAAISNILNEKLLSPLTLRDEEFHDTTINFDCRQNKRHRNVFLTPDGIYYNKAYSALITHYYSIDTNEEKELYSVVSLPIHAPQIYITKGGVTTGEYFTCNCYLRQETIKRGLYSPKDPIKLSVSLIKGKSVELCTIDSRDSKLKALKEFYDIRIYNDYTIKGKYDIRKYKKLIK
jgi:hypothetical protein